MRILQVYKDYYPVVGGIENNMRDLAEAFARRGHTVTALVTHPGRATVEENLNGVRVVKVGRLATVASTPLSLSFPRVLRSIPADVTHLHLPYPVGEVSQLLAGRSRPYVVTYHADVTRPVQLAIMRLYAPVLHLVLRRAARVIATSPNYVETSPHLRPVRDRVSIITSSVDARRFTPRPGAAPPHPPTLLFVGLMRHYKGVDVLLRAMMHLPMETRLLLAGDGPMRAEWEALRDALGLHNRVTFLGRVPDEDLPALYQSADIFVLPATSRAEALGLVMVEAMMAALPCVTTEVGSGTSYVVEHNTTGFVVPPRAPEALAGALNRLVADPTLQAQMGTAGRERAVRLFRFEDMVARVEAVYREVLSG
ncbi:MAG: Glycosyltransferase [Anaerolineales bacterium]|nr:Glycosyltransferase [Anaerolineales bacterium]